MHRAWPSHGREERTDDRGEGVWLSTQPFLDLGGAAALGPGSRRKSGRWLPASRQGLRAGEEIQDQDRMGDRRPVLEGTGGAAGRHAGGAHPLVHGGGGARRHGNIDQRAELMALSGLRNPYPGKLGVVEESALCRSPLVEGNPLENIKLVEDPAKNFVVIMKGGKIYKNSLSPLIPYGIAGKCARHILPDELSPSSSCGRSQKCAQSFREAWARAQNSVWDGEGWGCDRVA